MRTFFASSFAMTAVIIGLATLTMGAQSGAWFVGSKTDIAAVQAAIHRDQAALDNNFQPQIEGVHVAGNYALIQWWGGEAAGTALYQRTSGEKWKRMYWSGGATSAGSLPASVAKQLCSGWPKGYSPCGPQWS
jgi:hypothetical protein